MINVVADYLFNGEEIPALIFIVACLFMFVAFFLGYFFRQPDHARSTIMTLGILGTFGGISFGLMGFNSDDIEGSIPSLLNGLQTAFYSSIFGMFLTTLINMISFFQEKYISTIGEVSDEASDVIIKALEKTMEDFNKNLKEHFGENFSSLNDACSKLIQWQENYKEQIKNGNDQLNEIYKDLVKMRESYSLIEEGNKNTIEVHKKINNLIEKYENTINELYQGFGGFNEIAERGAKILNVIKKDSEDVKKEISGFSNEIQGSLRGQSQALEELTKNIKDNLPGSLDSLNQALTDQVKQFIAAYKEYLKNIPKDVFRDDEVIKKKSE